MQQTDALLLAALRAAPRRYRMPPLPVDGAAAAASGAETALAFAIEAARTGLHPGSPPPAEARDLFTAALAELIRAALAPQGGDPAFQALVLRAQEAEVEEYVRLAVQEPMDGRTVRAATDAVAHPGKLRNLAPGPRRDALSRLHALAAAGAWAELGGAIEQILEHQFSSDGELRAALAPILAGPTLQRLARASALRERETVQRYRALHAQRGPLAGSDAAAARGRASARLGEVAEYVTVEALREMAEWLNRRQGGTAGYRVVRSLRPRQGFPGEAGKAKDEWDAAIVRSADAGGAADVVLLAEVKASPAAATPDFSRLHRGLQRLGQASASQSYAFASTDGEVRIAGASLRKLQPHGRALPLHVIYCCTAPVEAQPQVLSAASKAVLLAEPASLVFAQQLARGASPRHAALAPVWEALSTAPRLRSALHQYDTAQAVREAMLHPDDLLAALARPKFEGAA